MEKINITELLKECPKGMELDCTMYENVEFDYIEENPESKYPIHCLIKINGGGNTLVFTHNGCNDRHPNAKCVIFPKGKTTWEGFVPPCQFKDGDIISAIVNKYLWYGIYQKEFNDVLYCYASYSTATEKVYHSNKYGMCLIDDISEIRLATEEEKEMLFKVIKDNGYSWNAETKTLEKLIEPKFKVGDRIKHVSAYTSGIVLKVGDEGYYMDCPKNGGVRYISFSLEKDYELVPSKFDINTLKHFDKVLVRDKDIQEWCISFFSHCNELETYKHSCINGSGYAQCIPYTEDTKHLTGTTNDCDDFYKTWEK